MMFEAERYIYAHPQTGFKEWDAHNYLKNEFEKMGFTLTEAGNIPGFYFDIDTGKDGPTVAVLGELDALLVPSEDPEAEDDVCAKHACGHNCQVSALLGVAGVLRNPEILSRLCGKIRIVAVPAEEPTELSERAARRDRGEIRFLSGKSEFVRRGYFNGVDIAVMVHTAHGDKSKFRFRKGGTSGVIAKRVTYYGSKGVGGSAPTNGVNALYAAQTALNSINALREVFPSSQNVRNQLIISRGGDTVQHMPWNVVIESNVRANSYTAMKSANEKINRAYTAAAVAFGARVEIDDLDVYFPERDYDNNPTLVELGAAIAREICGEDGIEFPTGTGSGGSDMGNLAAVIPCLQASSSGAGGKTHGASYYIKYPEFAVFNPSVLQTALVCTLLEGSAEKALEVISDHKALFSSFEEYCREMDKMCRTKGTVEYSEDGKAVLSWT
ncbi:MAG: M20/M25/M40 family metallo-hydrolase [Clostridia bacterium]|nr:M20/M25/M40 family metallo-hydrolase [Clostridia bacterium]